MAEQQVFATKGNLILYKKALKLAALGYELLDRKRNIAVGTQQCTAQIGVLVNDLKNFDKERIRKIRSMIRVIIFEDLLKLF